MSTVPLTSCPIYAPLIGAIGFALALGLTGIGAGYGTAKSGVGLLHVGVMRPDIVMRNSLPVVMAGIVAMYGLIVDIFIFMSWERMKYPLFLGATHLAAGLSVGLCGLASGVTIGIVGDAGVRGVAQQPRLFIGMILILIFAEVLGLYGMFMGVILCSKGTADVTCA